MKFLEYGYKKDQLCRDLAKPAGRFYSASACNRNSPADARNGSKPRMIVLIDGIFKFSEIERAIAAPKQNRLAPRLISLGNLPPIRAAERRVSIEFQYCWWPASLAALSSIE